MFLYIDILHELFAHILGEKGVFFKGELIVKKRVVLFTGILCPNPNYRFFCTSPPKKYISAATGSIFMEEN